ncbi:MAG: hypothetical protein LAT67_10055 [Balneolales bacterium]|nr:hypothetical protein [Balneolales bacterium]
MDEINIKTNIVACRDLAKNLMMKLVASSPSFWKNLIGVFCAGILLGCSASSNASHSNPAAADSATVSSALRVASDAETSFTRLELFSPGFASVYDTLYVDLKEGRNEVFIPINARPEQFSAALLQTGEFDIRAQYLRFASPGNKDAITLLDGEKITLTGPAGSLSGTIKEAGESSIILTDEKGEQWLIPNHRDYTIISKPGAIEGLPGSMPGLYMLANAPHDGRFALSVQYQTSHTGWQAEHQFIADEARETLDWSVLAHIQSSADETITASELILWNNPLISNRASSLARPESAGIRGRSAIYRNDVRGPVVLKPYERLMIPIHTFLSVPFKKEYFYRSNIMGNMSERINQATIRYAVSTDDIPEMPDILPPGQIRFFVEANDSDPVFTADASLGLINTQSNSTVHIRTVESPLVRVAETSVFSQRSRTRPLEEPFRREMKRTNIITNDTDEEIIIEIDHPFNHDVFKMLESTHKFETISNGRIIYRIVVPADGSSELSYRYLAL